MSVVKIFDTNNNTWIPITSLQGETGPTGAAGSAGPTGPAGLGMPSGGIQGQFLVKQSSTDYDAAWVTVPSATGVSF